MFLLEFSPINQNLLQFIKNANPSLLALLDRGLRLPTPPLFFGLRADPPPPTPPHPTSRPPSVGVQNHFYVLSGAGGRDAITPTGVTSGLFRVCPAGVSWRSPARVHRLVTNSISASLWDLPGGGGLICEHPCVSNLLQY
jgi:hypothetical protein